MTHAFAARFRAILRSTCMFAVLLTLAPFESGCAQVRREVQTGMVGRMGDKLPPKEQRTALKDIEVWLESGPEGITRYGEKVTLSAAAKNEWEIVGHSTVQGTIWPPKLPLMIAAIAAFLFVVVATVFTPLLFIAVPTMVATYGAVAFVSFVLIPYAASKADGEGGRAETVKLLKKEARRKGADAVMFVRFYEINTFPTEVSPGGPIASGVLMRRKNKAPPEPGPGSSPAPATPAPATPPPAAPAPAANTTNAPAPPAAPADATAPR